MNIIWILLLKGRLFPYDACHRSLTTLPARFGPNRPWLLTNLDLLLHDFNNLVRHSLSLYHLIQQPSSSQDRDQSIALWSFS